MSTKVPQSYTDLHFNTLLVTHHPLPPPLPLQAITIVTLNRPNRLNAFTKEMAADLTQIFAILSADERVKAIILTGAGRAFCAGADLAEGFTEVKAPFTDHRDEGGIVSLTINRCKKPVIAAINGSAVGVGITMTLPCSIRLTHRSVKIAFPFVSRGLVPEATSSWWLPRLIGLSRAMHVLITGETLLAGDKLLDGLFSEVLEDGEAVRKRAVEIAERLVRVASPISMALTKALLVNGAATPEETHLLDSRLMAELLSGVDKKEGVKAFLEKREPKFSGNVEKNMPGNYPWWKPVETEVKSKL